LNIKRLNKKSYLSFQNKNVTVSLFLFVLSLKSDSHFFLSSKYKKKLFNNPHQNSWKILKRELKTRIMLPIPFFLFKFSLWQKWKKIKNYFWKSYLLFKIKTILPCFWKTHAYWQIFFSLTFSILFDYKKE